MMITNSLFIDDFDREMKLRSSGRDGIDEEWLRLRDAGELYWTDKTGTVHALKDMTDDYIQNVKGYLVKSCKLREEMSKKKKRRYNYRRAARRDFSHDWSEDSDENWMPQEYLGGAFDGLF